MSEGKERKDPIADWCIKKGWSAKDSLDNPRNKTNKPVLAFTFPDDLITFFFL